MAVDRRLAAAAEDVQHFVVFRCIARFARAVNTEEPLLELGAPALGSKEHALLVGLHAPAHRVTLDRFAGWTTTLPWSGARTSRSSRTTSTPFSPTWTRRSSGIRRRACRTAACIAASMKSGG